MKHNIDRIIEACNTAIAQSEATELKRYNSSLEGSAKQHKDVLAKRKAASKKFQEMSERLSDGSTLTRSQAQFLDGLAGYYRDKGQHIKTRDLTDELTAPVLNPRPALPWIYELLQVMTNLKTDNDGNTTVSTSFLKASGFSTPVIGWVVRL